MKTKTLAKWLDEVSVEPKNNLHIYETEKRKFGPDQIHELAKRFNLDGKIDSDGDTHVVHQGRRVLITYEASGAFFYADSGKLHQPEYQPELPSEKEAKEIAVDYLKRNEWWPTGTIMGRVEVGQFERVEGKDRKQRSVHPNHVCVNFRFSLGQFRTYGPGGKIKVFLGHKGEVVGLFNSVRTLYKYAEYPPLSREDLLEVLSRKLNFPLEKIEVRDLTHAYLCESPLLDSRFVQPVYVFTLSAPIKSKRRREPTTLEFVTHPLPATTFAPIVLIDARESRITLKQGKPLTLSCKIVGGTGPFKYSWDSDLDGHLSDDPMLQTDKLSIAHRGGRITSHTVTVTVTDRLGNHDKHQIAVSVRPHEGAKMPAAAPAAPIDPNDPYIGVEWCNLYHGSAPDISGTDASAQGFQKQDAKPLWLVEPF